MKVGPNVSSPYEDRPLSQLRRVTAARLQEAKQTVPHFYVQTIVVSTIFCCDQAPMELAQRHESDD